MRVKRRISAYASGGFALPTILIASTVMLIVMGTALTAVSASVLSSLETRYYSSYAKNASQSGMAMAQACLKQNNYIPQWSNANPLRPNTNCSGVVQSGVSQYIHDAADVRSTFTVPAPSTLANGVQRITVSASSDRLTSSSGSAWRSYEDSAYATISAQTTFNTVTFGYVGLNGAFFGVVDSEGAVSAVGYNIDGQLGNGTSTNTSTPRSFILPAGVRASQLFSNFLSVGSTMFALSTDGRLYGAGDNSYGQLGNGTFTSKQSTPVQFNLPAGVSARYVTTGLTYTFVIGSDNNVYAAGACQRGILGYNYTIGSCSNQSTYKRVALPTVNTGNLNTLPVATSDWVQSTNFVADRYNAFIRMQGGALYGWGANEYSQLGNSSGTDSSVPVRYGTFGDAGQPKVNQVAFDGDSVWALDSNGEVWASGYGNYGQLGTSVSIRSSTWLCIDNPSNSTVMAQARLYTCNETTAQQLRFDTDGSIKFYPNASTVLCLDNYGASSANSNPIYVHPCNGTAAQKWEFRDNGTIVNVGTGKCLDNQNNLSTSPAVLQQYECNGLPNQQWFAIHVSTPRKAWMPSGQGKVVRMTTDQWSTLFLMENGTVWGTGRNELGQLGIGVSNKFNLYPKKMILPAGRTAVDFYTTATGEPAAADYIANSYVILDDGSVWGVGSNNYGQLGNGTTSAYVTTPVKMNLPAGVVARSVQAGLGTAVILTTEGRIYTVGNNSNGQLGDGTTTNSSTPMARQYVNSRPLVIY